MRNWHLRAVAALAAAVLFQAASFGGTIRADRSDSAYLSLGAQSIYAGVGQIYGTSASGGYFGSGTLIDPSWVLTAGHVVDVATALTFTVGTKTYTADKWIANPSWNGNLNAGYDIGLVHLSTPVAGITPAARYRGTAERGQTMTAVGYGMTGTGLTGATTFDSKKRGTQNVIDSIQNSRILLADFDSPTNRRESSMGSSAPLNLEGLIAPGDSGGGVFITSGGKTYLAGVNSFVGAYSWDGNPNSDYGDISGAIRVSAFNSWIDATLKQGVARAGAAAGAGTPPPAAAATVPEPTTLSLLAASALLFAIRGLLRRRAG